VVSSIGLRKEKKDEKKQSIKIPKRQDGEEKLPGASNQKK
jgi:hypothetical protein